MHFQYIILVQPFLLLLCMIPGYMHFPALSRPENNDNYTLKVSYFQENLFLPELFIAVFTTQ